MTQKAADGQIELFHKQQVWLVCEFTRLRRMRRTPSVTRQLRELSGRAQQINREIAAWIQNHS
ncbi:MAG TPA: hypothetical protein VG347_00775 [Verrucomicrobiae bacterium]|nr:hypothetical protein [Verrucomicrobiae bacterium]